MSLEGQGDSLIVSMSIFLKIFDLFDSMFVLNAISNFKANISFKKKKKVDLNGDWKQIC